MQPLQILRDPAAAAALLSPVRQRILQALQAPQSGAGLAREFDLPRQQLNYHLRELESAGFVELVEERRKGNCMERIVRAKAEAFVISTEALGALGPDPATRRDRFSAAYLVSAAARVIRDLAIIGVRAARAQKRFATLTIESEINFANAEDRAAFANELAASVAALTAKYHRPGAGRGYRVLAGAYPLLTMGDDSLDAATLQ